MSIYSTAGIRRGTESVTQLEKSSAESDGVGLQQSRTVRFPIGFASCDGLRLAGQARPATQLVSSSPVSRHLRRSQDSHFQFYAFPGAAHRTMVSRIGVLPPLRRGALYAVCFSRLRSSSARLFPVPAIPCVPSSFFSLRCCPQPRVGYTFKTSFPGCSSAVQECCRAPSSIMDETDAALPGSKSSALCL
ncbi:hypothetical protein HPB50_005885 [Hyalomma asiaticum]|uniref:Uncharacterized protein n=1 Tax=Hyalomma asiaticum TaxID=266040 RepID=A0ACB7S4V2_HYAAI|nr:hypothetical protein HPB50_005885 [Hyalomma asiaticum]